MTEQVDHVAKLIESFLAGRIISFFWGTSARGAELAFISRVGARFVRDRPKSECWIPSLGVTKRATL